MTAARQPGGRFPPVLKTAVGLLLAPVVGGAVAVPANLFVVDLYNGALGWSGWVNSLFEAIRLGAVVGGYMGVIPAFLFGVPVHTVLMKTGKRRLLYYAALGPVIALVSFAIVSPLYRIGFAWDSQLVEWIPAVLLCGAIGGILFWLIRRPDLVTKIPEPAP